MKHYSHVALGGTFDRLHDGHKRLIDTAFARAARVSIGVATPELFGAKKFVPQIEEYGARLQSVKAYLESKHTLSRATIFALHDIYGIAAHDKTLEALFVTTASYANAKLVSNLRTKSKLSKLDLVRVPLMRGSDGKVISSARIRAGACDRHGVAYLGLFARGKALRMPNAMRESLRKPLGQMLGVPEVYGDTNKKLKERLLVVQPTATIAVGDIITRELRRSGMRADIEIIDKRSKRERLQAVDYVEPRAPKFINRRGTISGQIAHQFSAIVELWLRDQKKRYQIVVQGEEDLTALPAILLAPLGSVVLYGHFEHGVIMVEVTERKKMEVRKILERFS